MLIRKSVFLHAWLIALVAGAAYYVFIQLTGLSLPCMWRLATGVPCPLCGATGMFLALARLDFAAAFRANPVLLILLGLWAGISAAAFSGADFFRKKRTLILFAAGSLAALVVSGILRLLP